MIERSTHIQTVEIEDPGLDGEVVSLEIHQVPGGLIGIPEDFRSDTATWIFNPFQTFQIVQLENPTDEDDDEVDPSFSDDITVCMLKTLRAVDLAVREMEPEARPKFLSGISKLAGLSEDQVNLLFGTAEEFVTDLEKRTKVEEKPKNDKPFTGLKLAE